MDEQQMNEYLKGAVESLLFISDKPIEIDQIKEALETFEAAEIRQTIKVLQDEYAEHARGMSIIEIAGGFQMLTNPQYAEYVRNFFKTRVKEKLSRPALEALAIIAYRQPVSRADVELIRGVNSDGVVTHLLEKGLIKIVGRKDIPGRPFIYGTTKLFLEYFGLKSLKDLPKLEDVSELLAGADQIENDGRGAGLFDSNKILTVEEAVTDFGGEDHLRQSFAVEPKMDEDFIDEEDTVRDNQADSVSDEEDIDQEQQDSDGKEEAENLKKVMDEMSREQISDADHHEESVEVNGNVIDPGE
jgi:segregation and condensation protein B